jgi:hypothetical protein
VELLFDPSRTPGLVDRQGNKLALRNDGTRTDPVAAVDLLVGAIDGIDGAFAGWAAANPGDVHRHDAWLAARSSFVDTFLAVDGKGPQAQFHDPTLVKALPTILDLVRAQTFAHCPGLALPCTWAQKDLVASLDDTMSGPSYAAVVDLVDALRQDDGARAELEQLLGYLVDGLSANDARATTLAAALDTLQVLGDDTNLAPLEQILALAAESPVTDDQGNVVRRGLVDAGVRVLSRVFEQSQDSARGCWTTRDPDRVLGQLLTNLVTPVSATEPTPFETIADVVTDVNRADPSVRAKLDGGDYGHIADETSQFVLDPATGLEQVYAIVRQATEP